jgi:hypothetical protein
LALNLSTFPEQIDTFIRHYDVGATDVVNLNRYQELRMKDSLTSAETETMSSLFSALRDKIWLAEDLNKLQDSITNLETFFKFQTEEYISNLFAQYDERMENLENRTDEMIETSTLAIDSKITEANEKIEEIVTEANEKISEMVATKNDVITTVYDSQYFNFDNMNYRNGFTRKIEKISDAVTVETIYNSTDLTIYATRTTEKIGESNYMVVTVCDNVEPKVNISVHTYKDENGNWLEDVITL